MERGLRIQRSGLHGMAGDDITSVLSSADTVLEWHLRGMAQEQPGGKAQVPWDGKAQVPWGGKAQVPCGGRAQVP